MTVDNLNGIMIKKNYIKVDHVKNYFLSKEFTFLDDKDKIEEKIFFASGPDGRGWAEDRDFSKEEFLFIEAQKKSFLRNNLEDLKKQEIYKDNTKGKVFDKKNELWDKAFLKTIHRMQDPEISILKEKLKDIEKRKKLIKKKNKFKK